MLQVRAVRSGLTFVGLMALYLAGMQTSARAADWEYPIAVGVAKDGTVYVADRYLPGVWKVTGGKPDLFFKGDKKFRTPLNAPRCIGFDKEGQLLVGDSSTREVYRFDKEGKPRPLTKGEIGIPMGIAVNSAGELLVSDLETHAIWKVPAGGGKPVKFADVSAPHGVALDSQGRLLVVSHGADMLVRIAADGKGETVVKGRPFSFPHEVVLDKDGQAFVSDGYGKAIWKVPANGAPAKWVVGKPLENPVSIAWRASGAGLLIVDTRAKQLFEADPAGKISAVTPPISKP